MACIRAVIVQSLPVKLTPRIISGLADRSSGIRRNAAEYLFLLLESLPTSAQGERSPFERHADAITSSLKTSLADALGEVRSTARLAVWAFHRHFPGRTSRLLSVLDSSTARLVMDEQPTYNARQTERSTSCGRVCEPSHATTQSQSRAGSFIDRTAVGRYVCHGTDVGCIGGRGTDLGAPADNVLTAILPPVARHPGGLFVAAAQHVISSVPTPTAGIEVPVPTSGARRVVPRAEAANGAHAPVRHVGVPVRVGARSGQACCGNHSFAHVETEEPIKSVLRHEDTTTALLSKAESRVWSTRAACCTELSALLRLERRPDVLRLGSKIVTVLLERLGDSHYRVVHASLSCVCTLLVVHAQVAEPSLERLLPQLLLRAQEPRDSTRAAATGALEGVKGAFAPEVLLPVLLHVIDVPPPRVRAAALLLLAAYALRAPAYVGARHHMCACVAKAHVHLSGKCRELSRAALHALHALHGAAGGAFVEQIALLPQPSQCLIASLMPLRPESTLEAEHALFSRPPRASPAVRLLPTAPPLPEPGSSRRDELLCGTDMAEQGAVPVTGCRCGAPCGPAAASLPATTPGSYPAVFNGGAAAPLSQAARATAERAVAPPPDPVLRARPELQNHNLPDFSSQLISVAEDWLALMPNVLRQLTAGSTSQGQRDGLLRLQKMALGTPVDAPVWPAHFEHVLEAVLRTLQHPDDEIREHGMATSKELLRAQPQRFRAFTEHVLLRLLAAGRDTSREVCAAAEEALELLLSVSDAHRCMAVLVPVVMREQPPTLQLAVRLQSKLVARFAQLQLFSILPQASRPSCMLARTGARAAATRPHTALS